MSHPQVHLRVDNKLTTFKKVQLKHIQATPSDFYSNHCWAAVDNDESPPASGIKHDLNQIIIYWFMQTEFVECIMYTIR